MKHLNPPLETVIRAFSDAEISVERQDLLQSLAVSVSGLRREGIKPKLTFICTHNSRRSQMAQCWAAAAAVYFGLEIDSYSGGTEVTALHPNAAEALQRAGFTVRRSGSEKEDNPVYGITCSDDVKPVSAYSKLYSDPANPATGYIAVMTCSEADEGCPYIPGADLRVSLPFEDPKRFDGTPEVRQRYDESCVQIGREIFTLFQKLQELEKQK